MNIRLRPATLSDVGPLNLLIAESVTHLSAGYYSPAQIASSLKYIFGIDTQLIHDGTYFVAESDQGGPPVGCGGWSRRHTLFGGDQSKPAADPLLDPRHEAARIRAFFVHPDWARQGIGRLLLDACEAAAQQAGFRCAELGATLPGEPLYAALGYTATERITLPFPDGEQLALVRMGKRLPAASA